ncbi:MAG: T9SS type A sorting domain-containing protein [Bacteroidales bacterium]|nr:T9SS type A sorting domain-containing protein [Bacteroidales bacterium]
MRHKKVKLSAVLLLGMGLTGLQAQTAIIASGGNASGSGGSMSYSVGQIVYYTNSGTSASVAEGVQQPYEISVFTEVENAGAANFSISVSPNPVTDLINLKIIDSSSPNIHSLSYQLYNSSGTLIMNREIETSEAIISLGNLVPATYFLAVSLSNKEVKSFKIIKN